MFGSSDIVGGTSVEITPGKLLLVELNQLAGGETFLDKTFPFLL
jgi:hypothetical protein